MTVEDGPGDTLNVSESVDSDELSNEDGDDVVDPPQNWKESDQVGITQREEQEGEPLDERLAEEEPDVGMELADEAAGPFEGPVGDVDSTDPTTDDTERA